ncbi:Atypical/TAF1 protein kinase [Rhodotorula toruloides ATCC 204091]|uniref:Atypical/TAF1 protein kinase n=1 Tax=Rhodotorula toruloides TaxID=5286 RepID=A0A0K3C6A7_RHOTO|nr:Atypical/TAF1 protein kinase [Rhodotorula toruloides ATCC 204091]KAK4334170.1 Transcription initiation factor TFIID subunit 1 [Rhodotorula toruloides]PRQ77341.1 Atypical/TAF1 protein kinase [Rhodotorula toruloides]
MDGDIASTLSGFALNEVLSSLDLDASALGAVQSQLGIKGTNAFSRDSIYADRFADDDGGLDDEDLEDDREDFEAMIDREMREEKYGKKGAASGASSAAAGGRGRLLRGEDDDFDEDYDEDEGTADERTRVKDEPMDDTLFGSPSPAPAQHQPMEVEKLAPPPAKKIDVKDLFPSFEHGKTLEFTELFAMRPRKKRRVATDGVKLALPTLSEVPRARSSRDALLAPLRSLPPSKDDHVRQMLLQAKAESMRDAVKAAGEEEGSEDEELRKTIARVNRKASTKWKMPRDERAFDLAELDEWEERIIWNDSSKPQVLASAFPKPLQHRNALFDGGDWVKSILWDGENPARAEYFTRLNLNLNDTEMLLEVHQPKDDNAPKRIAPKNALGSAEMLAPRDANLDPFNLSNDKEYEVPKEQKRQIIRQTFGALEVVHAYPAQKLQLPFYKTRLSKNETRSFHRPALQFPQNIPIGFTKVRSKKKKDKHGRKIKKSEGAEALRGMQDITLKDTSNFVLWEYSEEHPPIISNVGMGSIIVNYYRKKSPEDTFIPHLEVGQPLLLEGTDESPFKMFGFVHPGQTVTTLYNNLIRAPLFRHQPNETDFLVVRVTIDGETHYYIRSIPHLYVVGQTYPQIEVPGPHSRKVTTLQKNRLMTIAFKLVAKNKDSRIKVHRLTRYFPDHNDLQMRQKLKEFMEFVRKGDNQGFWMIKPSVHIPSEAEMLKMAEPETVCLAESMQVGLRTLQDAGYTNSAEEGGAGEDDSKLDIEQQLAPWITTKNFVNANANKAMLKLHGEGDPTGRGEAFSFLRTSMKDIFLRAGETMEERLADMANRPKSAHKYNVQEQQEIYKEEIARIWKSQWDSLSQKREPLLTQEDEDRHRGRLIAAKKAANKALAASAVDTPGSAANTPARAGTPGSRAGSVDLDDAASVASGRNTGKTKTLRIKRLVMGKWETEIVRDPSVIKAYVHQRALIDEEKLEANELLPSDDESKNERRKKRLKEQLEKLKRNQERRLARKNQKLGIAPGQIGVGGKKAVKTETTRVCGNCGQRGHMKTSRKLCPRWAEFNQPKSTDTGSALPTNFGGGLALPPMGAAAKPTLKVKLSQANTAAGTASSPPPSGSAAATPAATPAPPADQQQPPPPPAAQPGVAGPSA